MKPKLQIGGDGKFLTAYPVLNKPCNKQATEVLRVIWYGDDVNVKHVNEFATTQTAVSWKTHSEWSTLIKTQFFLFCVQKLRVL